MSKKQISEGIIDKVLEKIFGSIAKGAQSAAIGKLKKDNPDLAKDIEFVEKKQKEIRESCLIRLKMLVMCDTSGKPWSKKLYKTLYHLRQFAS